MRAVLRCSLAVKDIKRGYVCSDAKNDPAVGCESFEAQVGGLGCDL